MTAPVKNRQKVIVSKAFISDNELAYPIGGYMPKLVALGANLPYQDRLPQETIQAAIVVLGEEGAKETTRSRFYVTPCFPEGAGPDFINAVISVDFDGTPQDLVALCHRVEERFGRTRNARWSARTLDVDLLCWDDQILPNATTVREWIEAPLDVLQANAPAQLILPHPRIQDRGFVLVPMADLAPDWCHPILGQTVKDMLARLPEAEIQAIYAL